MTKRTVGRPREGNTEETRKGILEAARRVFAASGFAGATTRQVAAEAGVNVATLHYHFGSKEGLYDAVRGYTADDLPFDPRGDPEERLGRLVGTLFDRGRAVGATSRLSLFDLLTDGGHNGRVREGRVEDPRVTALGACLKELPSGPGRAPRLARWLVALIDVSVLAGDETVRESLVSLAKQVAAGVPASVPPVDIHAEQPELVSLEA